MKIKKVVGGRNFIFDRLFDKGRCLFSRYQKQNHCSHRINDDRTPAAG